jgi:hypothetical protein
MRTRKQKELQFGDETYDRVVKTLCHPLFLEKKGLANDLPYFICPYDPATHNRVCELADMLVRSLAGHGVSTLTLNLYDVALSILKADGYLDRLMEQEESVDRNEFLGIVRNLVDPATKLVPTIAQRVKADAPDILFLSGMGDIFPFIRPHSILSHLQASLSDQLTVMFFPGDYSYSEANGATLDIFGLRQEERYYRAFNIFEYEV